MIQDIDMLDVDTHQNIEFQGFPNDSEESDVESNKFFKIISNNESVYSINKTSDNKKPKINNIQDIEGGNIRP